MPRATADHHGRHGKRGKTEGKQNKSGCWSLRARRDATDAPGEPSGRCGDALALEAWVRGSHVPAEAEGITQGIRHQENDTVEGGPGPGPGPGEDQTGSKARGWGDTWVAHRRHRSGFKAAPHLHPTISSWAPSGKGLSLLEPRLLVHRRARWPHPPPRAATGGTTKGSERCEGPSGPQMNAASLSLKSYG